MWKQPTGARARAEKVGAVRKMHVGSGDGARTDHHDDMYGAAASDGDENSVKSSVKMKLNTFCPDRNLRSKIQETVIACNIIVGEAYALTELHVTRDLEAGRPLTMVTKQQWETLYYQSMCAVCDKQVRDATIPETVKASAEVFERLRPPDQRRVDGSLLGDVLSDLRRVMATSAVNSLNASACGRLKRYLRWAHPDLKSYHELIVGTVLRWPKMKLDGVDGFRPVAKNGQALSDAIRSKRLRARRLAESLRDRCPITFGVDKMYASTATKLLPLMHHILRETEQHVAKRSRGDAARRFTLLPSKHGCTVSNVPLCTRAMLRLVGTLRTREGRAVHPVSNPKKSASTEGHAVWRRFFDVNLVETQGRRFDHQIVTDGCSVSVLMTTRQAHIASSLDISEAWSFGKEAPNQMPVYYIGVDPGVTDVATWATYTTGGGEPVVSSYSSSRYYHDAKYKISNRRTGRWNEETRELAASLNVREDRSTVAGLEATIRCFLAAFRALIQHRAEKGYRNMRFMRHVQKQRTVQKICDSIAPPDRFNVVGFGDWKGTGATPIKRRYSGAIQDIKRELRRRTAARGAADPSVAFGDVWEYKTSITEHTSLTRMVNMVADTTIRRRDGVPEVKRRSKVHKVLHARKSVAGFSRTETTWNRDVNAARNILMLLMMQLHGFERPPAFCRSLGRRPRAKPRQRRKP